jgi:hypothetical protein
MNLVSLEPFYGKSTIFWAEPKNQREYLHRLSKKLNVNRYEDWYRIHSYQIVQQDGGSELLKQFDGSLAQGKRSPLEKLTNFLKL